MRVLLPYNINFNILDLHLQENTKQTITEGEELVLHCLAEGEPQKIRYSRWIHTGEFIRHRELAGDQSTDNLLSIKSVTYRDTGIYICQADNGIYNKQRTSEVFVRCELIFFIFIFLFSKEMFIAHHILKVKVNVWGFVLIYIFIFFTPVTIYQIFLTF